jgi:thymidine kinase
MELKQCNPNLPPVTFFAGGMWTMKSSRLIGAMCRHRHGAKEVVVLFSPKQDTRTGEGQAKSHDGLVFESISCGEPDDILKQLPEGCTVVGIEEIHMWMDPEKYTNGEITAVWDRILDTLENENIRVYIAGLDKDFRGHHFESFLVVAKRSLLHMEHSFCGVCRGPAFYSALIAKRPDGATIIPGAEGTYMAMCRFHFLENSKK